ncbi:acyl-CoA thioesterase II [Stakelama sediminis]|uniref:Acyl-CoA thioesterase 2 n=1 Tax=Stakelama sediminis TaxID=463200 RepID=A0A840YYA3_9SPHN|nr:acyl-CoA thioesterase II [Stakelama sediminis]MBB5718751.1 acyl-CoA thioesterase-2 [Stakelama sediminis]
MAEANDAQDEPTAEELVGQLTTLLDVEELDIDLFRGSRQPGGVGRVFGGQVVAQALQAAQRSTEDGKIAHSLHAYFMRPGDERYPVIYRVVRDFEGRSFATRRVIAMQRGQPILNMAASFQKPEDGFSHQDTMPDVPPPESLKSMRELRMLDPEAIPEKLRKALLRPRPIDLRPVNPQWPPQKQEPVQHFWLRTVAPLSDEPALHRAVLAYASDMGLLGTSLLPHGLTWTTPGFQSASLDHALWLHEPFRADQWLLYSCNSPWTGHARGFNRGSIFTREGKLVASVAQEGLIRLRKTD